MFLFRIFRNKNLRTVFRYICVCITTEYTYSAINVFPYINALTHVTFTFIRVLKMTSATYIKLN